MSDEVKAVEVAGVVEVKSGSAASKQIVLDAVKGAQKTMYETYCANQEIERLKNVKKD